MAKYIDIEPLEKDGWMLRRNTFTIDSATVELKHLRDFPTVEISDIITSDNEYMGSVVQGRWIPVTEGLPRECTRVIGYMAWKTMTAIEYQHGMWYSIDHLEPLPDEAVSHWMPLPQPPKEGENERT